MEDGCFLWSVICRHKEHQPERIDSGNLSTFLVSHPFRDKVSSVIIPNHVEVRRIHPHFLTWGPMGEVLSFLFLNVLRHSGSSLPTVSSVQHALSRHSFTVVG